MPLRHYPKFNVLFVHVNKTGGSSICEILREGRKKSDVEEFHDYWTPEVDELPWDRSFVVSRPPVDRFMSAWNERAPEMDLIPLLKFLRNPREGSLSHGGSRSELIRRHFVFHNDRAFVYKARFLLRLHSLAEDWDRLAQRLGLPRPKHFPHARKGRYLRRKWSRLSDAEKRLVEEFAFGEGYLNYGGNYE